MSDGLKRPAWMEDDLVKNIPQKKLEFMEKMFQEGHGKNQKEMMRHLLLLRIYLTPTPDRSPRLQEGNAGWPTGLEPVPV